MRTPLTTLLWILAAIAALPSAAPAQDRPWAWKIRPHLADSMAQAKPGDRLPVYFVMRDRMGYHHWFPRVHSLDVDARRALVIREMKAHAKRTQRQLLDVLRRESDANRAHDVQSIWLGNLVRTKATVQSIDRAARLDGVWEVWPDTSLDPIDLRDAGPAPSVPGNGPLAVRADQVWNLGYSGLGMLVMNADSGINIAHKALQDAVWVNRGEIPFNGIDDDNNGFIDDINGWNFAQNNNVIEDYGGHGTQTAGVLVGSQCNGVTIGIAPAGDVMTAKLATETDQWAAVQYAIEMGADTQTSSHSYKNNFNPPPNYAMHRDIGEASLAAGLIRTNSTSNSGMQCRLGVPELRRPFNVSTPGNLPAPYLDANQVMRGRKGGVIGVGAHSLFGVLDPGSPCGPSAWNLPELLAVLPSYPLAWWDPQDNDYPWLGGLEMGLIKPDVTAPTGTQTTAGGGPTCITGAFGGTSNSTPIAAGCMLLWKQANKSLTPEDVGMIVHQTSIESGSVPGKENNWGAGKIDALNGLMRALAVHRVNGEPAWDVAHQSGAPITFEVDGVQNRPVLIALGLVRQDFDFGVVTSGIGSQLFQVFAGSTGPSGTVKVQIPVPPLSQNLLVYSQAFIDDRAGRTKRFLTSNVIETEIIRQ